MSTRKPKGMLLQRMKGKRVRCQESKQVGGNVSHAGRSKEQVEVEKVAALGSWRTRMRRFDGVWHVIAKQWWNSLSAPCSIVVLHTSLDINCISSGVKYFCTTWRVAVDIHTRGE